MALLPLLRVCPQINPSFLTVLPLPRALILRTLSSPHCPTCNFRAQETDLPNIDKCTYVSVIPIQKEKTQENLKFKCEHAIQSCYGKLWTEKFPFECPRNNIRTENIILWFISYFFYVKLYLAVRSGRLSHTISHSRLKSCPGNERRNQSHNDAFKVNLSKARCQEQKLCHRWSAPLDRQQSFDCACTVQKVSGAGNSKPLLDSSHCSPTLSIIIFSFFALTVEYFKRFERRLPSPAHSQLFFLLAQNHNSTDSINKGLGRIWLSAPNDWNAMRNNSKVFANFFASRFSKRW